MTYESNKKKSFQVNKYENAICKMMTMILLRLQCVKPLIQCMTVFDLIHGMILCIMYDTVIDKKHSLLFNSFFCLFIHPSIYPSIHPSVHPSIHSTYCLSRFQLLSRMGPKPRWSHEVGVEKSLRSRSWKVTMMLYAVWSPMDNILSLEGTVWFIK